MALPFVVAPRLKPIIEKVGSDEAGYIEIERRGYLTGGEKAFVQQAISSDDGTLRIIGLARKIASSRNLTLEEAYRKVISILGGSKDNDCLVIEEEYFEEFNDVLNVLALMQSREELITAVCMLKYRVNPDTDIQDVMDLHPDIISGIAVLYKEEERKSVSRLLESQSSESQESLESEDSSDDIDVNALEKKQSRRTRQNT